MFCSFHGNLPLTLSLCFLLSAQAGSSSPRGSRPCGRRFVGTRARCRHAHRQGYTFRRHVGRRGEAAATELRGSTESLPNCTQTAACLLYFTGGVTRGTDCSAQSPESHQKNPTPPSLEEVIPPCFNTPRLTQLVKASPSSQRWGPPAPKALTPEGCNRETLCNTQKAAVISSSL